MESEIKYKYWKWSNSTIIVDKTSRQKPKQKPKQKVTQANNIQNKREISSDRISQREMHIQTSINPYMRKMDYVNDLTNQDKYLRPLDSNF